MDWIGEDGRQERCRKSERRSVNVVEISGGGGGWQGGVVGAGVDEGVDEDKEWRVGEVVVVGEQVGERVVRIGFGRIGLVANSY